MAKYSHTLLEVYVLILTLFLVGLNLFFSAWIELSAPYLLLIGFVFPGIPHGAIDHYLAISENQDKYYLLLFVLKYTSVMVLIGILWFLQPLVGLTLFIFYSAWHFGETDMRRLKSFHPLYAFLSGFGMLTFMLSSHGAEFRYYLTLLGVNNFKEVTDNTYWIISLSTLFGLIVNGLTHVRDKTRYFCLLVILVLGSFLPLLLAFGIYFILIHSVSGWIDIKAGLKISTSRLLIRALPFSIGAFVVMGAFIFLSNTNHTFLDNYISSFFIALAAISAPHILLMSKFYHRIL
jgi:beta-carotene 15,15'-dioxygenase